VFLCSTAVKADSEEEAKKAYQAMGLKCHRIKRVHSTRTVNQNNALHLLFEQLTQEMLDKGFDMKDILKDGFEFPPSAWAIKEFVWKKVQKAMYGKESTTDLAKLGEIDKIYDVVNKTIIEKTKGEIKLPPFPSVENMMNEEL